MAQTIKEIYEFDEFRLDVSERLLLRQNEPVPLPEKAFETLRVLIANAGSLVEKEEILNTVWAGAFVEENNLDKNISILRRALGKEGKKFIETVRGHGYRFIAKVRRIESDIVTARREDGETGRKQKREKNFDGKPVLFSPAQNLPLSNPLPTRRAGNVVALAQWRRAVEEDEKAGENVENNSSEHDSVAGREEKAGAPMAKNKFRLYSIFAALVLIAVAGFLVNKFFRQTSESRTFSAPLQTFKIKRFSDNGSFKQAVISRNGKFIAYTDKKFAVWLKNTATDSNVKTLSEIETGERQMIGFSPDDDYVYFYYSPKDRHSEILKIPVFGGAVPQKISEDAWSQPTLSPDGKFVAFTRFNPESGNFSLIAASTDGAGERAIAVSNPNERFVSWVQNAAWSPDASRVACIGKSETEETASGFIRIFQTADGAAISRIEPDSSIRSLQAVAWLPDGDNLLIIGSDEASPGQIYRYTISTKTWRRITNDLTDYMNLSVTADGKTILTTIWNNQSNLWILPEADAARARQITFGFNTIFDSTGVSWTADGKQIVYASNTGSRWEIWMIDADGANQKQLTTGCAGNESCAMPFVSPDNRYIVFQASRGSENNIWRMDIDGANPVRLTTDGGIMPFVTADSRSVIYVNKKVSTSTLMQISIDGGEPRPMSKIPLIFLGNSSPDGRRLAFVHYEKTANPPFQTCVASPEADRPEKCFDKSRAFPFWTADGAAFYYLAHDYSGIRKQPLSGESVLFLEFAGERINNFAFSPDGKNLVVARSKPTQNIVALIDGE